MSENSRNQREKLKEEYKQHYRKMRETKERLKQSRRKNNIVDALRDMDSAQLMESFDSFLFDVKSKVAHAEARLDVALDSLDEEVNAPIQEVENDEVLNQAKAKETLKQLKNEMGMLYSELERQAEAINVDKTIGKSPEDTENQSDSSSTSSSAENE
jgi:phosphoglycerate-specific signal transduction histidine kinase